MVCNVSESGNVVAVSWWSVGHRQKECEKERSECVSYCGGERKYVQTRRRCDTS